MNFRICGNKFCLGSSVEDLWQVLCVGSSADSSTRAVPHCRGGGTTGDGEEDVHGEPIYYPGD